MQYYKLHYYLGTHQFQNAVSSSLNPGELRVTGTLTKDPTATGVLVIVSSDSEVIYHKATREGSDEIIEAVISGLAGGEYSVSVFVVEDNGLPFGRVVTLPQLVAVERCKLVCVRIIRCIDIVYIIANNYLKSSKWT